MRASHQRNFWTGLVLLGRSAPSGAGPWNPTRFGSQLTAWPSKPGVLRIANPRKSFRVPPSGQSNARRTRVGERNARDLTFSMSASRPRIGFLEPADEVLDERPLDRLVAHASHDGDPFGGL